MLVIGSRALIYHFPSIKRIAKDVDVIGYKDELPNLISELQPTSIKESKYSTMLKDIKNKNNVFNQPNVELIFADDLVGLQHYLEHDKDKIFASVETLFSLKKSHIHFPINFKKHIHDYCFLRDKLDGYDALEEITKIQFKETEERLGKLKTPSLNKSVDKFFGQSTEFFKSYFVHDDIHKVMAHYEKPLYEKMQSDKDLAKCDKDKWRVFPYEHKCQCVLEEAYVIALERKIIPMIFGGGKGFSSDEAFDWALMRICTTLCSGWFREFATNNYFIIKMLFNKNYVEKFLTEYENGNIKRQPSN
jgi:hypothetical protein